MYKIKLLYLKYADFFTALYLFVNKEIPSSPIHPTPHNVKSFKISRAFTIMVFQALYGKLFSWIVHRINALLRTERARPV